MTSQTPQANPAERWYAAAPRPEVPPTTTFTITAIFLAVMWLAVTGWIVTRPLTFGSPDEAANHYFMTVLVQTGHNRVNTGLPDDVLAYLHPRSMTVQAAFLAPGSFLGLIQASAMVIKTFGAGTERMITPLLSLGGLLAAFFIFRRFWGRWWALLGAGLIAIHPAFFEFATLPYLHNGAFVAALMIAAWALLRLLERPSWHLSGGFGLAFGAALFFRPVEGLWTVPAVLILLVARKLWRELLLAGVIVLLVQLPWLLADRQVFGSLFASAYTPSGIFNDATGGESIIAPVHRLFTPAGGVWSWHWLSSAWWYFFLLVPAWSAMSLVAISRYFRRKYVTWSKSLKLTVISLVGVFPLVYYGTWNLYPATPAADVGALASYVRYWLPLYIIMAPGVIVILQLLRRRWLIVCLALILGGSQIGVLWVHPVSGLRARLAADAKNRVIRTAVVQATEPNAILIAGHDDKYFQDQRLSAFRLPQNDSDWKILKKLQSLRPVYLYAAVGAVNISAAQNTMATYGLQISQMLTIGRDTLWKITTAG